jgi:hypothetical protein
MLGHGSQAKQSLKELKEDFRPWWTEHHITPEKPMRNNSVMQSLKDLKTLLRPGLSPSFESPEQLPMKIKNQASRKHTASESLFGSVTNVRSSLKSSIATSLRASARSAFKRSLPALPSSKPRPTCEPLALTYNCNLLLLSIEWAG